MTEKTKAKRQLKGFDFSKSDARVALVGPSVGGPANGIPTLIAKANNFSPEAIKKMQQIQVTYELPEFLRKVFGVYYEDAEILAKLLGYVEPEDDSTEMSDNWYENYIEEKLSAFTIIKSLHEAENLPEALSKLTETDYLDVLNDQVLIEKALKELAEGSNDPKVDTSIKVEKTKVEGSPSKINKKEKPMTQEIVVDEKSKLVDVQKALEGKEVELQKALAKVKEFEDAQVAAIVKSKTEAVESVIKDKKAAAVVVKAVLALDETTALELVDVFKQLEAVAALAHAPLFQEIGASGSADESKPTESKLAQVIKSKYPQNK